MFSICTQDGSIPRSILCDESERLKLLTTKGWNIIQTPFQVRSPDPNADKEAKISLLNRQKINPLYLPLTHSMCA